MLFRSLFEFPSHDIQAKAIYNVALNEAYVNKIKKNVSRLVEIQEIRNKIDAEYELMKTHAGRVKLEKDGVNVTDRWIEPSHVRLINKHQSSLASLRLFFTAFLQHL